MCDLAIKKMIKIIHLIFFKEGKPQEVYIVYAPTAKAAVFQ